MRSLLYFNKGWSSDNMEDSWVLTSYRAYEENCQILKRESSEPFSGWIRLMVLDLCLVAATQTQLLQVDLLERHTNQRAFELRAFLLKLKTWRCVFRLAAISAVMWSLWVCECVIYDLWGLNFLRVIVHPGFYGECWCFLLSSLLFCCLFSLNAFSL